MRVIVIAALAALLASAVIAEPIEGSRVHVEDGDTIEVDAESFRLVGFDAPETGHRRRCAAERELGARATRRLREIVAAGGLDLERIACSCRPGSEGKRLSPIARMRACGRQWQGAKADDGVKAAGWPAYWSACSKRLKAAEPPGEVCNYGRSCGTLRASGRDVGDILIAEGLAKPYPYDWQNPPPKPDWCR